MRAPTKNQWAWLLALSSLVMSDGCRRPDSPGAVLFAASSCSDTVPELVEQFSSQSGKSILSSFAGSSTLAIQIANGAEADLFLSADEAWVQELHNSDLIERWNKIAENQLCLITHDHHRDFWQAKKWNDLNDPKVSLIAIANPDSVPAGKYAKRAMQAVGVWDEVQEKLVYATSVRQVLNYVDSGNVQCGFVYATDARLSPKVSIVETLPISLTGPIEYVLALTKTGGRNPVAREFFEFCNNDESAAAIFAKFGFRTMTAQQP